MRNLNRFLAFSPVDPGSQLHRGDGSDSSHPGGGLLEVRRRCIRKLRLGRDDDHGRPSSSSRENVGRVEQRTTTVEAVMVFWVIKGRKMAGSPMMSSRVAVCDLIPMMTPVYNTLASAHYPCP